MATKTQKETGPAVAGELVTLEEVKRLLLDPTAPKLSVVEEDPEAAARRIIARTLNAESVDQLWDTGVVHAKDCVGRAFRLHDVEWRNSDIDPEEGGLRVFAVMHAAFCDTGEQAVITCGAAGVVSRLVKLAQFDQDPDNGFAFPIDVVIRGTKTKSGYTVFDLDAAPDGF